MAEASNARVTRAIAVIGLVALAVWSGVNLARRSGDPSSYYEHRDGSPLAAYPTTQVLTWLGVIAIELVAASLFLWFGRRTSLRIGTVSLLFVLLATFGLAFVMHAPPYFNGHVVFLFLAACWTFVMTIAGAIEARLGA